MAKAPILIAILLVAYPVTAQFNGCLDKQTTAPRADIWVVIKEYFKSLTQPKTVVERARYTSLRADLVNLEAQKLKLIALIESHLKENVSGVVASNEISVRSVPEILSQINYITQRLDEEAKTGGLFSAEPAFKQLKIQLDLKRTMTLCEIAEKAGLSSPNNRESLRSLQRDLQVELDAISAAEEQLAKFIQTRK